MARRPTGFVDVPDGGRKADRVAEHLLASIVRGELPVGSLLPKEAALAERYRVNRSVVREAVKLLEVHRLVRPKRRVGTEVLDPLASMSPEVLQVMLAQPSGAIDLHVLESFLEIRAVLDEQMSALAAERRSRADLTALRAIIRDLRAFADPPKAGGASSFAADPARFYARVKDVGFVLARATKNPIYLMLAHWNLAVVARLEHVFGAVRPAPDAHADGLDALARAVEDKDAKTARDLVRSFHAWANPRILATAAMSSGAPLSDLKKVLR